MELTKYTRKEDVKREWFEVNAEGLTLGRLATKIADVLRGKNKPHYTPSVDCGDYVIVTNAAKIHMTGNKWADKKYYHYSGYQSGLREISAEKMVLKHPEHIITHAVKGMLPKNKLARQVIKKLKVYEGNEHPHTAQEPKKLEL
ncbi:MAG: 50S ribosomal protein L13 [bacterium]